MGVKTTEPGNARTAILYDYLQVQGGAELVTLNVCRGLESCDLICGFVDQQVFPSLAIHGTTIRSLIKQSKSPGLLHFLTAQAFIGRTKFISRYDRLIFSGSFAPLAIKHSQATRNLYYCHTPPRFVYDLKEFYLSNMNLLQRPVFNGLVNYLRPRYEQALQKMDKVFANSENTKSRLKTFCGVDSEVLYPPCEVEGFDWAGEGHYFLSTARLESYKRVDIIIDAFLQMPDKKLIVASGGSEYEALKRRAAGASNISFTGWVSNDELRRLVGYCLATIYIAKDEDFGISPVQSMAAGKPVIGAREGGLLETVVNGETGFLLELLSSDDLVTVLNTEGLAAQLSKMREACEAQARLFSKNDFSARLCGE
jgi:glycosyltransferase involved in cell wall biosynthesis